MSYYSTPRHKINKELNTFTDEHVKALRNAMAVGEFVIDGAVDVPKEQLSLYFRNPVSQEVHVIDFPPSSIDQLAPLVHACSPAAFGLGTQDVYDPTYRKALKLDTTNFAINFSPERLGIMDVIERRLGNSPFEKFESRKIYAELYKLNCYVEGDFFKAHKDTPRAYNMLGSLVVNLPTAYSGGELIIRVSPEKEEHICDWAQTEPTTSCSWAAFYSDMEHEIYPVTSGQRITLTYNIYFDEEFEEEGTTGEPLLTPSNYLGTHPFYAALDKLVNGDPTFLRLGGIIITFLTHEYPTFKKDGCGESGEPLLQYLKGSDHSLYQIAQCLDLKPVAKALVSDAKETSPLYTVLSNVKHLNIDEEYSAERSLLEGLDSHKGDFQTPEYSYGEAKSGTKMEWENRVIFLNKRKEAGTAWTDSYLAYGNQASLGFLYGKAVLTMHVRPWGENGRVPWPAERPNSSHDRHLVNIKV